jgi:acyl carrier protein
VTSRSTLTLERIRDIMILVFPTVRKENITERTSRSDIEKWDSLQHLNLVMLLETEFKVQFTPEEINSMKNIRDIKRFIEKKTKTDK